MKRSLFAQLSVTAVLAMSGCGGGGTGGGGGGFHTFTKVINTSNDPMPQNWMVWPSLSWTGCASSVASTMHVGTYMFSSGLPAHALGMAFNWYSRPPYNWDGLSLPPFVVDTPFAVASGMTDRYYNDVNHPEINVFYQGWYQNSWDAAFTTTAINLVNHNKPFIAQLILQNFQEFVLVRGLQWVTDSGGNFVEFKHIYIYDPRGVIPPDLTPAVTNQYGILFAGVAWMEVGGPNHQQRLAEDGKHLDPIKVDSDSRTHVWPGTE